jgi:hypothetical protein
LTEKFTDLLDGSQAGLSALQLALPGTERNDVLL